MLKKSNCECIGKWYFGQDYLDLLQNSASDIELLDLNLLHKVLNMNNEVQEILDGNMLSDSVIIIAKKGIYE